MKYYIDLTDRRNVYLKEILENKNKECLDYNNVPKHNVFNNGDCIIFSPAKKIDEALIETLPKNIKLICGNIKEDLSPFLKKKNIQHCNMLTNEIYAIKNAKLTAEGVLSLIIEKNDASIFENKILILGAGRIAKACAILFEKLNLNYTIASYNKDKFPQNFLYTNNTILGDAFFKKLNNFDVIINTIPARIFKDSQIKLLPNNALFIETASTQCLNKDLVKNFNYLLAPGLPQKYSPKSAGKLIYDYIKGEHNG